MLKTGFCVLAGACDAIMVKPRDSTRMPRCVLQRARSCARVVFQIEAGSLADAHAQRQDVDRALFSRCVGTKGVSVEPKQIAGVINLLAPYLLNQPKIANVTKPEGDNSCRLVLLHPDAVEDADCKAVLEQNKWGVKAHEARVSYDYFSQDQVLRAVLPKEIVEISTAFTIVGHIAHLNLREHLLPYKKLIGTVVLDKNPKLRTVVNKIESIDSTYRFFKMELIAGADEMTATIKENGCLFTFDFSKVYWNSRLQQEHSRLIKTFKKGETVVDMFAGVGPFAIPAAKKGLKVYANDLNPESFKAMEHNAKKNGATTMSVYNKDGRDFIRDVVAELETGANVHHVAMNLPATAIEFLGVFRGLYGDDVPGKEATEHRLPMIHCYCFSKGPNYEDDIVARIETHMGHRLDYDADELNIHDVRDVAPQKRMFCVSFRLPRRVAFRREKRRKLE